MARRVLVFGATGAIGSAVASVLTNERCEVVGTSRTASDAMIAIDPFAEGVGMQALAGLAPFDAIVWAQGTNRNDSLLDFDLAAYTEVMNANCGFVVATLAELLRLELLRDGARLCMVSSIWQEFAREQKLSYTVSKAALAGVVRSAAADLAGRGMLVNAVLPSVTDTPMTRSMLTGEQVERFAGQTGFARLTTLDDVANTVVFLCSERNTGITGQSIAVDLGYAAVRRV